jgi:hypothetical protein
MLPPELDELMLHVYSWGQWNASEEMENAEAIFRTGSQEFGTAPSCGRSVPRRSARSFIKAKKTGTRIST